MPENRLVHEKSPYLLQHAHNPVDWFPWGDKAFEEAARDDKPIFLSIGYSTCHWCHVMEHESFEDPEVAALLNDLFVCIKVDREERPDIDSVYMAVCQMMTGSGGWPLTIIMTPEQLPFFAATYIPKASRWGRVGMLELLPRVKSTWDDRRHDVLRSGSRVVEVLEGLDRNGATSELNRDLLDAAQQRLAARFDARNGGFGGAPKFPTPHYLTFLLRDWKQTGRLESLEMVKRTLRRIRLGGIFDHLGFGFHRYSTDDRWLVPHFEKMLYDQALLLLAYSEAFRATGDPAFARIAREIVAYVQRDLTAASGAFFSAEDADSEGVEGKFYRWQASELRESLTSAAMDLARTVFDVHDGGNFLDEATGQPAGDNILHLEAPLARIAQDVGMEVEDLAREVETIRARLLEVRSKRVRPSLDDKVLTDWNGLMIAALARASAAFGEPAFLDLARRAADFVLTEMVDARGRLLHRFRDGEAAVAGFLDDHAFLAWGLTELYQASYEPRYLVAALDATEQMLAHFWDHDHGGLFMTADDAELVLVRRKESYDGATPSGASVAAVTLIRLARLTGRPDLEERSWHILRASSGQIRRAPEGHTHMLQALDLALGPSCEVVVVGHPGADDTRAMLDRLRRRDLANTDVLFKPEGEAGREVARLAPFCESMTTDDGKARAYVCHGSKCEIPTTDPDHMVSLLAVRPENGVP